MSISHAARTLTFRPFVVAHGRLVAFGGEVGDETDMPHCNGHEWTRNDALDSPLRVVGSLRLVYPPPATTGRFPIAA